MSNVNVVNAPIDTDINIDDTIDIEWDGRNTTMTQSSYDNLLRHVSGLGINTNSRGQYMFSSVADSLAGIFGMPYQFSRNVDPPIEDLGMTASTGSTRDNTGTIGRKFSQKIF